LTVFSSSNPCDMFQSLAPVGFVLQLPCPLIKLQSGIQSYHNGVAQALFRILTFTTWGVGT
jgi:hypothetical protein